MATSLRTPLERYPVNSRMYSALVNSLRGIVWEADPATFQFRFVSDHAEALLGFPKEEWLEDPEFWRHHTHPDDLTSAAAFRRECIAQIKDHDFEYRMIARGGRVVWLRDIVTVERSLTRKVRLRGIMIDITDQRAMQDELRKSQERLAHAQHVAGVGMFDWDLLSDHAVWTPELKALYGEPELPTAGQTWFQRIHPDDMVDATDAVQDAMDSGVLDVEYRVCWPDASIHWLHARGRAARDATGRPVRMLGAVVDVTDRKRLEQELHQAQKMEALGRLAGGIAHDFNNLLSVISSYGDMLAPDLSANAEHTADLREIRRAAHRGTELTRQLLAFSRNQSVQPELVPFDAEVSDLTAMLDRVLGSDVHLVVSLGCGDARVLIAPGHLQQVVMNLAVNARDAMPAGGSLSVTTREQGDQLALVVSDTGEGMTDSVKSHIFEPFFTTKAPGKGTGLGLSTVFGIVHEANGTIEVDSRKGEGTTIEIRLPRASAIV